MTLYRITSRYLCEDVMVIEAPSKNVAVHIALGASGTSEYEPEIKSFATEVIRHYEFKVRRYP